MLNYSRATYNTGCQEQFNGLAQEFKSFYTRQSVLFAAQRAVDLPLVALCLLSIPGQLVLRNSNQMLIAFSDHLLTQGDAGCFDNILTKTTYIDIM